VGSLANQNRSSSFIEVFNDIAVEAMSLKSDGIISQGLAYHDSVEAVFFYVQYKTDDSVVSLMYPDIVFDPGNYDSNDIVDTVCAALQEEDRDKITAMLVKAEIIAGRNHQVIK